MKRLLIIALMLMVGIGAASAQKKEVVALGEELNTLKAQNVELQNKLSELAAVAENNKVLVEQLQTMVAAYETLENAYKTNSEQVATLTAKIDELLSAAATKEAEAEAAAESAPASTEEAKPKYEIKGDINDGLALVKEGLLYGYVNAKGEIVIAAQFEEATDFAEGMAAVKVDNKWGYIDTTGKFVIAAKYQEARSFGENQYNGMARVKTNNKWGIINKSGQFVVAATYDVINVHPGNSRGWWICWSGDDSYNVTTNGRLKEW